MKTLLKVVAVLAVLVIAAVVLLLVFLDTVVEESMEAAVGFVTESKVEADGVDLQPFSGRLVIDSLTIGNPPGFPADTNVLDLKGFDIAIDTASLGGDEHHLKTLMISGLVVELRQADGKINLIALEERLRELSGTGAPAPAPAPTPEPTPTPEPPTTGGSPDTPAPTDPTPAPEPAPSPGESDSAPAEGPTQQTYKIDKVRITGVVLRVKDLDMGGALGLAGVNLPSSLSLPMPGGDVPLPDIELDNLEGDMSEITLQIVEQLAVNIAEEVPGFQELRSLANGAIENIGALTDQLTNQLGELGQQGEDAVNNLREQGEGAVRDAEDALRRGAGDLFGGGE